MAILRLDAGFHFQPILDLIRAWPDLGARYLQLVGKRARTVLKKEMLSGQILNVKNMNDTEPLDSRGRRMITSHVHKSKKYTLIASYPTNPFNKGRMLRSGKREAGKHIIDSKLKNVVAGRAGSYVSDFERQILEPEIKKVGL